MRALITNDDGVDSRGIRTLAAVAVEAGLETTVAAPGWDSSGAAASLTAVERDGRFLLDRRTFEDLADVEVFAVEAAPAFIVRAAVTGAFGKPPDLVLSGINRGPNTGHAVLHSGTVGAALTASTFGVPAMAVSHRRRRPTTSSGRRARPSARVALRWLLDADDRLVLNVNAPNMPARRAPRLPAHRAGRVRCGADGGHRGRRGLRQAVLRGHRRRARAGHRRRRPGRRHGLVHRAARGVRGVRRAGCPTSSTWA